MNIFITGATGYIGSLLMESLIEKGHTVHALYRPSSFVKVDLTRSGIRPFEGDLLNLTSLEQAMKGCEQAYHVAAYARPWAADPSTYYNVNVKGTHNVLSTAKKTGLEKVVVTSTAATLPASTNGSPVDETSFKNSFNTEYARTKHLAEEEARLFSRRGLHTVIVIPPRVYGPGMLTESNAASRLIKLYLIGIWRFLPGDGSYIGNYVFVDDVVRGHRLAMEKGRPGHRYIVGGKNTSLKELFQLIKEISGVNRKMWPIPVPFLRAFAKMEEWKADTLNRKPLITPGWLENYLKDSPLSSEKAIEELDYRITPIKKGLEKTIQWLNEQL